MTCFDTYENRIYNCDCRELLQSMIDNHVQADCIITDPPYLINYSTHDKQKKYCKPIEGDKDEQLIIDIMPMLYEVLKDNSAMYMFCGSDKVDFFKQQVERCFHFKNLIVWDKGNHTKGDLTASYGKAYEFIIYAEKGRAEFRGGHRYSDIWNIPKESFVETIHQNQKPVPLIERILKQHTKPGDLVLDAFMGGVQPPLHAQEWAEST